MNGTEASVGTPVRYVSATVSLLLMVGLVGSGSAVHAQFDRSTLVASVQIKGNSRVATSTILANLKTRPDHEYSQAVVQEDLTNLTKLGFFRDVKANPSPTTDGRVIVEFVVTEHPNLVTEVIVKNNRHVSLDEITLLKNIREGTSLNPSLNRQAVNEIREQYHNKGYMFATVSLEEGAEPTDKRVVFNITEGPVVKVRSIRFVGNDSLATTARLRTQVSSSAAFLRLIGGTYNQSQIDYDVHKLEEYYRNNGYLDVKVARDLEFSDDIQWVDVIYHIYEGPRYRVHEVSVDGIQNLPKTQVESVLQVRKGDYYNEHKVEGDIQNIKDTYGWRGYQVPVKREHYYPEPGLVHVRYQVLDEQRPPAKVGQIIVIGNDVTKRRVILRALGIYPGQTMQFPLLRQAERNLARLNIFNADPKLGSHPTVSAIEDPNNQSEFQDVLVQVQETPTGSLIFGASVNSNAGLVGSIVLNERNFDIFRPPTSLADIWEGRAFRGGGQELRIEALPGTQLQRYSMTFREPFLFDLPYSFTASGYYYNRYFNVYTEKRLGGRFTVGHQLNPFWSVAGTLRIEDVRVDDVPWWAPSDYTSVANKNNLLVAPRINVTRDTRDSFLRPTEGSLIDAAAEYAFGSFNFPIFNVEGNKFFTTYQRRDGSGKHVLALRSQVSFAGSDVPVYERFFGGGYQSIRGFQFRGVGPFVNGYNVGGRFMFLNSLEYQIPILANDNLYAVAFLDSGTVERDISFTNYRVAAGFGLRFVVPGMGPVPISVDFGFPINKAPQDQTQIFQFYVGFFR